jgi:hypothetical protein
MDRRRSDVWSHDREGQSPLVEFGLAPPIRSRRRIAEDYGRYRELSDPAAWIKKGCGVCGGWTAEITSTLAPLSAFAVNFAAEDFTTYPSLRSSSANGRYRYEAV